MISLTVRLGYLNDGPRSPCSEAAEVVEVLPVERLVEAVVRLEVAENLGGDGLFRGEGAAGHEPDHEERRRDDDPQDGDHLEQTAEANEHRIQREWKENVKREDARLRRSCRASEPRHLPSFAVIQSFSFS
jgi:hypothetical protein